MSSDSSQHSHQTSLPATQQPTETNHSRKPTPAERLLGLVTGQIYRVTSDTDQDKLFFLRAITTRDSWNDTNTEANTLSDLFVTFYHTPIINDVGETETVAAGNIYNISDENVSGPLRINAKLLNNPDAVTELPTKPTWMLQSEETIQPLTPTPELEHILSYAIEPFPTPN